MTIDLSRGACAGMADSSYAETDPFHPEPVRDRPTQTDPYAEARAICGRCALVTECLQDALTETVQWGFRGGMDPEQRDTLRSGARTAPVNRYKPTDADLERRVHLHSQGLSDGEIAVMVGLTDKAVMAWRHRNQLPSNHPPITRHTEAMNKKKWELWQAGALDKTIAEEVGIAPDAVRRWRRREGLETNRTRMRASA